MKEQTAQRLSGALSDLERTREDLENAPEGQKAAAAGRYLDARAASSPAFSEALNEYDLEQAGASTPGAESPPAPVSTEPLPNEAAPGVPLVAPPGVLLDVTNLERYGPLVDYWSKSDPTAAPVKATPYAFAPGTPVATAEGEVATAQNSRIVKGGDALAIVPQDEFEAAFTAEDPTKEATPEGVNSAEEDPAKSGAEQPAATPPAQAGPEA